MTLENKNKKDNEPLFLAGRNIVKRNGEESLEKQFLICENEITIRTDEKDIFKISCLKSDIEELAAGKICTTYNIHKKGDIKVLKTDLTSNEVYIETGEIKRAEPFVYSQKEYSQQSIFTLADRFKEGMELHKKTYMTHSAIVMYKDEIVYECEDINRYNVLYKALGYMILNDINPYDTIVYFSGRVDLKVLKQVEDSCIGIFVSKSSATKEAVIYSKEKDMTLICMARPDSFVQYKV